MPAKQPRPQTQRLYQCRCSAIRIWSITFCGQMWPPWVCLTRWHLSLLGRNGSVRVRANRRYYPELWSAGTDLMTPAVPSYPTLTVKSWHVNFGTSLLMLVCGTCRSTRYFAAANGCRGGGVGWVNTLCYPLRGMSAADVFGPWGQEAGIIALAI
jgi:hypothetical protein